MSRKFKFIILLFLFLIFGYYFIFSPRQVKGKPIPEFTKDQIVLSSKLVYFAKSPQIGDRILFLPQSSNNDYVGLIKSISEKDNVKIYTISSQIGGKSWEVTRDKIHSYIWYPF